MKKETQKQIKEIKTFLMADNLDLRFMPAGNRVINPKSVGRLKLSMQRYGIVRGVIIIKTNLFSKDKTEYYYIVDGQHLYIAAEALGMLDKLPVFLTDCKFETVTDIINYVSTLNSSQTPWTLVNYVAAFASTNQLIDYNILYNKYLKYGIPLSIISMIYGGSSASRAPQLIKNGLFKVVDEKKGNHICEIIQDIIPIFGKANSTQLQYFVRHFYNWYGSVTYNHEQFLRVLKDNTRELLVLGEEGLEVVFNQYNSSIKK